MMMKSTTTTVLPEMMKNSCMGIIIRRREKRVNRNTSFSSRQVGLGLILFCMFIIIIIVHVS